ncbi:unnamed protein product [Ambrosiozyma monospora]|uniref:Unnamed protein product n=1 Tax=Ambrosiozyma monospora TaxID=43982 RepID=A0ACB5SRG7_AMBMO|nr:unnamed protein product [Ambrosiozyma monospora]
MAKFSSRTRTPSSDSSPISSDFCFPELLNDKSSVFSQSPTSSPTSPNDDTHTQKPTRKRQNISPETKELLESVFFVKRNPNLRERKALAERCGLSVVQVRIWFANKRARCKGVDRSAE